MPDGVLGAARLTGKGKTYVSFGIVEEAKRRNRAMSKPIPKGGGALNEMSFSCAERALTYLMERYLAHRGLTAEITVRRRTPEELAQRERELRQSKEVESA